MPAVVPDVLFYFLSLHLRNSLRWRTTVYLRVGIIYQTKNKNILYNNRKTWTDNVQRHSSEKRKYELISFYSPRVIIDSCSLYSVVFFFSILRIASIWFALLLRNAPKSFVIFFFLSVVCWLLLTCGLHMYILYRHETWMREMIFHFVWTEIETDSWSNTSDPNLARLAF